MKELVFIFSLFFATSVFAGNYVVLPKEEAKAILQQCSRNTPEYEDVWNPTPQQIEMLEEDLFKLQALESK